jgi:purine nucleoside permease
MRRVDFQRVLVLRTGSNYSVPAPDQSAAESLTAEYQGMRPALESAYLAGSAVVHKLIADWSHYGNSPPTAATP